MREAKFASIKLTSGEEIVCYIINVIDFGDTTSVVIKNPLKLEYSKRLRRSYKFSPWILFTTLKTFDIPSTNIISICPIDDDELEREHSDFFDDDDDQKKLPENTKKDPTIGYVGSVDEYKKMLERIYKTL